MLWSFSMCKVFVSWFTEWHVFPKTLLKTKRALIALIFTAFVLSLSQVFEEEGLFMWARSIELARFPRSRLAALFFGKKNNCFKWEAGLPRLPKARTLRPRSRNWGWKFFHMTIQPGWSGWNKIASLSQQQWQKWHNFWLVCFSTLVVKLKQSTKPYNSRKRSTILVLFLELHAPRSTGLKFPKWTDNIHLGSRAARLPGS